jgi:hypothetical protein
MIKNPPVMFYDLIFGCLSRNGGRNPGTIIADLFCEISQSDGLEGVGGVASGGAKNPILLGMVDTDLEMPSPDLLVQFRPLSGVSSWPDARRSLLDDPIDFSANRILV